MRRGGGPGTALQNCGYYSGYALLEARILEARGKKCAGERSFLSLASFLYLVGFSLLNNEVLLSTFNRKKLKKKDWQKVLKQYSTETKFESTYQQKKYARNNAVCQHIQPSFQQFHLF